jgi:hypothetical protein
MPVSQVSAVGRISSLGSTRWFGRDDTGGEAKGEFSKYIKAKKLRGLAVELQTIDKMAPRQLTAK